MYQFEAVITQFNYTELLYNPAGIGCRENCMLKEAYSMNTLFDSVEVLDNKKEIQKENSKAMNMQDIRFECILMGKRH